MTGPTSSVSAVGAESAGRAVLNDLLANSEVILVVGPGGVGKTTTAAALGASAAIDHGRRALVVTIDPAKRLAQALGAESLWEEPVLVPTSNGRLWAEMIDMSVSWDNLVRRHAPTSEIRNELLANPLYKSLTRRFVQSHDYIALDHLVELADDVRYDLVIIDTPPSVHVLDVLDAPRRMEEFFDSRLLRWLTATYRSRLIQTAARPFLSVAERLLGGPFLSDIADFFWLFSHLQPGMVKRTGEVTARLSEASTKYVVVHTPEAGPAAQANDLTKALAERHHPADLAVINRALPESIAALTDADIELLGDDTLESQVGQLRERARRSLHGPDGLPTIGVPYRTAALKSVDDLAELVKQPS